MSQGLQPLPSLVAISSPSTERWEEHSIVLLWFFPSLKTWLFLFLLGKKLYLTWQPQEWSSSLKECQPRRQLTVFHEFLQTQKSSTSRQLGTSRVHSMTNTYPSILRIYQLSLLKFFFSSLTLNQLCEELDALYTVYGELNTRLKKRRGKEEKVLQKPPLVITVTSKEAAVYSRFPRPT